MKIPENMKGKRITDIEKGIQFRVGKMERLISYYHTITKKEVLAVYVRSGRNEGSKNENLFSPRLSNETSREGMLPIHHVLSYHIVTKA